MIRTLCAASAAFLLFVQPASAKIFRNSYVSFELPDSWECVLEGTEWVCRSTKADQSKEAIIILTAKEAGASDNLQAYEAHLKTPRMIVNATGHAQKSQVVQVTQRTVNGQIWVDGLQLGSEIPNYYTRYLATVKDKIAVLVTFSAHKLRYTKYSNDFFNAILSLRVVANQGPTAGTAGSPVGPLLPSSHEILGPGQINIPTDMTTDVPDESTQSPRFSLTSMFALIVLVLALAAYLYVRKKRKK